MSVPTQRPRTTCLVAIEERPSAHPNHLIWLEISNPAEIEDDGWLMRHEDDFRLASLAHEARRG
jgi:hypothetical protein